MPVWDADVPLYSWSNPIQRYFRSHARLLLDEITTNELKVVLTPAPQQKFVGHMIRSVESENPGWYKAIYSSHHHWNRTRTLRSLGRIILGKDQEIREVQGNIHGAYSTDAIIRSHIYDHLTRGMQSVHFGEIPACDDVRHYFGLERIALSTPEQIEDEPWSFDDPVPF